MGKEISFGRQAGRFFGEKIGKPILDHRIGKVNSFELSVTGQENVTDLTDRAVIFAANHLRPDGVLDTKSGFSPDAFSIVRAVREATGKSPLIISKSDDGWIGKGAYGLLQKKDHEFRFGFIEGLGNVPVKKNPGHLNREFLLLASNILSSNGWLLQFPQGVWESDFDPEVTISSGMAHLAIRNNAVIIPTFIKGATNWEREQKVVITFGSPISPQGKEKSEVNDEWLRAVFLLQEISRRA